MQEYYFLFALALIYTIFATVQDLKSREVANWLTYTLIAFGIAYRIFYSIENKNSDFLILGILGMAVSIAFAYALYYGKVFAGGDAKLLMGFGLIFPYKTYFSAIIIPASFVFILLSVGAVYSLLFSVGIALKSRKKFKKEIRKVSGKNRILIFLSLVIFIIFIALSSGSFIFLSTAPLFLVFPLYVYAKAVENCMIVLLSPQKLTEGDWIESDIKISKNITIKKTVHGLSKKDIALLKKHKKSVPIKQGIPFVPAFLIALIITIILIVMFREFHLPIILENLILNYISR